MSGNLVIVAAEDKASLAAFIDAPTLLYRDMPGFEPTLFMEQDMSLSPKKSTFFQTGQAKYFLAKRDGKVVGRISAQISPDTPRGLPDKTGMFGCFDVSDDLEATKALFAAAESWLREKGCKHVFGPCTLHMNGEPGLMISGQNVPRMIMTPWHPPYLAELVEASGYKPRKDLLNWRLDTKGAKDRGYAGRVTASALGANAKIRILDKPNIKRDIQFICDIYNDAWSENEFFVPLHPIDLHDLEKSVKPLLPADACIFVEIDGKPAGAMVIIPNLFEIFRGLGSRPNPRGWMKLGWRLLRHRFKSGRIILFGVARKYNKSVRGMAIAIALVEEVLKRRGKYAGVLLEAGWVLEDNDPLNTMLKRFEFEPARRFRMFLKDL
ncbi:hypothetical protein [Aestuariivirga litoralis]|uniref:hypothetical protein n=1 Tax=Aestuariivirga litoralis TaxID=2650924 RepID=UPI0018C64BA4|nr:hypothetical protein [Aestuariivirga litoralis]MBG1232437.1 hypothetical protein [Aestuariivirga litoralis]